jgi:cytochrome c oxidase cbb3-type subunit III
MADAVTHGRPGTAMQAFAGILSPDEIDAVVMFVTRAFIEGSLANVRYHIPENGWDDHERYRDAFPFALGELAIDTPGAELSEAGRRGKRLFMSTCITCHDHGRLRDDRTLWEPRAVSFPRGGYSHRDGRAPDAETGATPYARHEQAPELNDPTPREQRGEALFQDNCAFCHAADGTGRNWIGSFIEPRPRDLTDPDALAGMTPFRLREAISDGVAGTSMPAWKTVFDERQIDDVAAYVEKVFLRRE